MSENQEQVVVHPAGPPIRVGFVIRQRCAWCGALIEELDLENTKVLDGDPPLVDDDGLPTRYWTGLVAVRRHDDDSGSTRWQVVPEPGDETIPENSCMAIDATVTQ